MFNLQWSWKYDKEKGSLEKNNKKINQVRVNLLTPNGNKEQN